MRVDEDDDGPGGQPPPPKCPICGRLLSSCRGNHDGDTPGDP